MIDRVCVCVAKQALNVNHAERACVFGVVLFFKSPSSIVKSRFAKIPHRLNV